MDEISNVERLQKLINKDPETTSKLLGKIAEGNNMSMYIEIYAAKSRVKYTNRKHRRDYELIGDFKDHWDLYSVLNTIWQNRDPNYSRERYPDGFECSGEEIVLTEDDLEHIASKRTFLGNPYIDKRTINKMRNRLKKGLQVRASAI